jgi:hypothetical protein
MWTNRRTRVSMIATILGLLLVAVAVPSRGQGYVVPCDALCTDPGNPYPTCVNDYTYSCSLCLLPHLCTRNGCWDFAFIGTQVYRRICNGQTVYSSWVSVPCGGCFP